MKASSIGDCSSAVLRGPRFSALFQLFVAVNVMAFYGYLFWDSISGQQLALVGGPADFLFAKHDRFMDWVNTLRSSSLPFPYAMDGHDAIPVYPPLVYLLLSSWAPLLLSSGGRGIWTAKIAWVVLCIAVLWLVCRNMARLYRALYPDLAVASTIPTMVGLVLLSYPFLFAFDRGNLDLVAVALISWFALRQFLSCETPVSSTSLLRLLGDCLILALAASIKPYTFLFILLAVAAPTARAGSAHVKRLILMLIGTFVIFFLLFLVSLLWLYKGDFWLGVASYQYWQGEFSDVYIIGGLGDKFFCSPYVLLKFALLWQGASVSGLAKVYPWVALVAGGAVLFKAFRICSRRLNVAVVLTAICFCLLVFPYNANEYKAVYLVLPFLLFFQGAIARDDCRLDRKWRCRFAARLFARVLAPLRWSATEVSVALCFVMLLNRYGLIGDRFIASAIASMALMVFPVLFLSSRVHGWCPGPLPSEALPSQGVDV